MACEDFVVWVRDQGSYGKAATVITEHEEGRGRDGVTAEGVRLWCKGDVPVKRVLSLEELTGISRHVLRPDIYPPAPESASA